MVFAALIVLTAVTVWISHFHFGAYNLVVAMGVAAIKASLVALFFMHLKYDNKLYMTIFLSAIAFLAIFIVLTMFDNLTRGRIDEEKVHPINPNAVIYRDSGTVAGDTAVVDSAIGDTTDVDTLESVNKESSDTERAH
jgi:cytochrome c oxidase subunit 4